MYLPADRDLSEVDMASEQKKEKEVFMDQEVKMQEAKEKNVTKKETAEQMIKDHGVPDQDAGMAFQDAAIDEDILRAVLSMGFETMSPIQEKAIPLTSMRYLPRSPNSILRAIWFMGGRFF